MFQQTNLRENQFRAATTNRSSTLRALKGDNTFGAAKNLGTLSSSGTPVEVRMKGSVRPSDKVDVFKLRIDTGVDFRFTRIKSDVSGGKVKLRGYLQDPLFTDNRIILASQSNFRGSSSSTQATGVVNTQNPFKFYYKFSAPAGQKKPIQYDLKLIFIP